MSAFEIPVRRHRLDNGLRVVLSEDRSRPVVAVNLWYGVGSRNEVPGRTGFAHLFEHMMFQGSAHVPKNGHFEYVERAGGSLNGSTWFDRTNYYETLPSHELELGLWLESDRMGWLLPAMTQEKLDNQRDVVKNEKRQRYDNRPYGHQIELMQQLLYPPTHPYHHSVIGSMEDLDAASLDDVASFFRTFYVPNNAVLTLCGDIDDSALERVERYFGPIPEGEPVPAPPGEPDPGRLRGPLRRDVVDEVPLPRVLLGYRIPPVTDETFYAARVTSGLLASGRASKLYGSLVRGGLAKDVSAFALPLVTGRAMFLVIVTGLEGSEVEALENAVIEEIRELGPEQEALERTVALMETQILLDLERVGERADLLSMSELYFGDPARVAGEVERIRTVGRDDVRAFAERHLAPDARAVVSYTPEGGRG